MMKAWMFSLMLMVLLPLSAAATPVLVAVEPWESTDGDFSFSLIHGATGDLVADMDGASLSGEGAVQSSFLSPSQRISGDLTGLVLILDATTLQLDDGSALSISTSVLDFGAAEGELIGSFDYELVDVGGRIESGVFYFVHVDSADAPCGSNGFCSERGEVRLTGNNWGLDLESRLGPNVVVDDMKAISHRGIRLGGSVVAAPVPEPSAALLFGVGSVVVASGMKRS